MDSPKITIIVPVYNAENTIKKCLNSIIAQTLKDWELILVDDGSPDGSGHICDEYAMRDSRFKVIHQDNAGVSAARQTGLDAAIGEYIIHADPDDWVEPLMLEELYNKAKNDNADMVICDFFMDYFDNSTYKKQEVESLQPQCIIDGFFCGSIHGSCCNKLVKHSVINDCGAKFPKGINYCEDICFNVQLLRYNIRISYINKAYYHYVQHSTSVTNSFSRKNYEEGLAYINYLCTLLPNNSFHVYRAKEWLKKEVFRNKTITDKEMDTLFPEIKKVNNEGPLQTIMYSCAFNGYHLCSKILLRIYRLIK